MQFSELLFGITRKGMTVVIADDSSQPAAVTHPGMVLGDYARREFAAVDTALIRDQYSAGHAAKPTVTSVVVSSKDKTVTVFEDGQVVAPARRQIAGGNKPLGENVYTLTGAAWRKTASPGPSVGYGKTDREDMGSELRRITADPQVREADPQAHAERHDGGDHRPAQLSLPPRLGFHHPRRRLLTKRPGPTSSTTQELHHEAHARSPPPVAALAVFATPALANPPKFTANLPGPA